MPVERIKLNTIFFLSALFVLTMLCSSAYAAPCYGTKLPGRNKFFAEFESYSLFKRYQENNLGKLRSQQQFYGMSYGVFNWLSIDLKAGAGNIKQHPVGSDEIDYTTSFAGGYGLRVKFLDKNNFRSVLGFQHISVHPKSTHIGDTKHQAILDDWQWSLLGSYSFKRITPYLGTRWSRVDYIHKVNGDRKRVMSDMTKDIGFIYGFDLPLTNKIWLNMEGSSFDSDALAVSINYSF
ncbi:MAG: hypothetical protein PHO70_01720 [Candidatus Omnitrophica bacterium]|nr:hypothetical protein [Candidatus Omnitrophota bacterium]